MPVPSFPIYSVDAIVAAHTAFRTLIDSGGSAGSIRVRNADDEMLAQIPLGLPCGTIDPATGRMTFVTAGNGVAGFAGVAAYGEFCDSFGTAHLALPAEEGEVAVGERMVMNALGLELGDPVGVQSATIGGATEPTPGPPLEQPQY